MSTMPKNKFAAALKQPKEPQPSVPATSEVVDAGSKPSARPSRQGTKHVGGYFDPAVSKQLRQIALHEDSSVQALMAEAIDMLFQSRRQPTIAKKAKA